MNAKTIVATIALAASLSVSWAQSTVNFAADYGEPNIYYAGVPLPAGNEVRIGCFSTGFNPALYLNDLSTLFEYWSQYGYTTTRNMYGDDGRFQAMQSLNNSAMNVYDNKQIWLWILKTTGNTAVAPDFSNVEAYGLYSSTAANWIFPRYGALPPGNTTSISTSEVNQALWGTFDIDHLYLTAVPEPSGLGLMVLGMGAALMLRHRNKKS